MKILVVEDDKETREYLLSAFSDSGYRVEAACDGPQGKEMASSGGYDLIILDRMLPGCSGLEVLERLRQAGVDTPVIILSALSDVDHRIEGLASGGNDYVVKPFSFQELLLRARLIIKKHKPEPSEGLVITRGAMTLDVLERTVVWKNELVPLKPKEFELIKFFLNNAGLVVARSVIFEQVWGYRFDPGTNVIDVHVAKLRQKLGEDAEQVIETVRGSGYRLNV